MNVVYYNTTRFSTLIDIFQLYIFSSIDDNLFKDNGDHIFNFTAHSIIQIFIKYLL